MNANPPIRQRAITYLQRLLLSTQLSLSQSTQPIFDRVLFPIMDELLKSPDPALAETRLRTAGLLCKVFLADATRLADSPEGVIPVFTRLLTIMERMVRSEKDGMVSWFSISRTTANDLERGRRVVEECTLGPKFRSITRSTPFIRQ